MVPFYSILETTSVGGKKHREDNNKKQGFLVQEPLRFIACYRKVGRRANIVRAFLRGNHAFWWVFGPES